MQDEGSMLKGISVVVTGITPELARQWLNASNKNNRNIDWKRVDDYASIMEKGEFLVTNDAIGFDINNRLFNGQHRLWAIVKSGVTVDQVVMHNANPDVFKVADQGKRRTNAQTLSTMGYDNTQILSTVVNLVIRWEAGSLIEKTKPVSSIETISCIKRWPILVECTNIAHRYTGKKGISFSASVVAFTIWLANFDSQKDEYVEWIKHVAAGVGFSPDSPEIALHRRFRNKLGSSREEMMEQCALLIKAYHYSKIGRKIQTLVWSAENDEKFPEFPKLQKLED